MNPRSVFLFLGTVSLGLGIIFLINPSFFETKEESRKEVSSLPADQPIVPTPLPSPTPTPVPLPDPKVYGPCKNVPVLLYHHIQPKEEAVAKNQIALTTYTDFFQDQLEHLKQKGYTTITPTELLNGLLSSFPPNPIILTFDDAYEDFYKYAYPLLVKQGMKATVFVPTGLVNNPGYLTWQQIEEMKSSTLITFANHTWSHKNIGIGNKTTIKFEIETAQQQLKDHGIQADSFAYPYGFQSNYADKLLQDLGIKTAFTTVPGSYQCAKLPFEFRRSRIGNLPLFSYGL